MFTPKEPTRFKKDATKNHSKGAFQSPLHWCEAIGKEVTKTKKGAYNQFGTEITYRNMTGSVTRIGNGDRTVTQNATGLGLGLRLNQALRITID